MKTILTQSLPAKHFLITPGRGKACFGEFERLQFEEREERTLQLDDHLKRLLRELGHAINDTVSESDRISEAISGVRAAGYDIVLKLDATIGLARREPTATRITSNDRRFLESLHIQVDQDVLEEEKHEAKFEITPQDLRFLKSLKISFEDPK
jgi:hypothetical protein